MNITLNPSPNRTAGRNYYWTLDNLINHRVGKPATVDKIVYHWIDGTLADADAVFANPAKQVSAHYAIENDQVHQYVSLKDTAWHCGVGRVNSESVGIEHSAQPGRDATDATYESSALLVVQVAQSFGKRVDDFQHLKHNQVLATQCPGTLDIGRIVQRAREIEGASNTLPPVQIVQTAAQVSVPVVQTFWVTVTAKQLIVRTGPGTNYPSVPAKQLAAGNSVECFEVVTGNDPYGDGRNLWLHTEVSKLYIWAGGTNYQPKTNQT